MEKCFDRYFNRHIRMGNMDDSWNGWTDSQKNIFHAQSTLSINYL